MTNNIVQVINEDHILEILDKYKNQIVVIMFASNTSVPCTQMKRPFVELSKKNPETIFIFVDIRNYTPTKNVYYESRTSNNLPLFKYYLNNQLVGCFDGADPKKLSDILEIVKNRIDELKQEYAKNINKSIDKEYLIEEQKKMIILKKLKELSSNGHKLSRTFTIDSDFRDMAFEYYEIVGTFLDIDAELQKACQKDNSDNNNSNNNNIIAEHEKKQEEQEEEERKNLISKYNQLQYQEQADKINLLHQLKRLEESQENVLVEQ